MKTPFRADYTYTVADNVIAIIDLDQGSKSRSAGAVTNDMENVLDDIQAELGDLSGYRTGGPAVIYRDSTGRWDGVRLERSLVEFYSLNETDPERAVARLLHPLP